jgi:hypothetical protein
MKDSFSPDVDTGNSHIKWSKQKKAKESTNRDRKKRD